MNDLDNYAKGFVSPLEDDLAKLEAENKQLLHDKELLIGLAIGSKDLRLVIVDLIVKRHTNDKGMKSEILATMMEQLNVATDLGQKRFEENTALRKRVEIAVKHTLELTAFLHKIVVLGLLRGSPRLRDEALRILDGFEQSDIEGSVTQDIGNSEIADQVMKIIGDALSGDCQKYLQYDMQGKRYCKWGIVEKDIRALFDDTNPDYHNPDYSKTSTDNNKGE